MLDAVGIAIVDTPPPGVARVSAPARHCSFVGLARQGKVVWASSDEVNCPIARYVLGCDSVVASIDAAAASFVESKLARDLDAAHRFVAGFRVLAPQRRIFVYFPLGEEPVPADVVVRFVRPEEAMRRLRALVTATGERAEVRTAGSAAMCADCTASPILTGRAALSPGCPGSRREVPIAPDEVLVSLPANLERALHAT